MDLQEPGAKMGKSHESGAGIIYLLDEPEVVRRKPGACGRLDQDVTGLVIMTTDGQLAHRLISPKKEVPKVYYARHEGQADQADVDAFAQGLTLRDGTRCLSARLTPLGQGESEITVCEGKYHQVRRMMASRNMTVTYLERIREGGLTLEGVARGQCRCLTEEEMRQLLAL